MKLRLTVIGSGNVASWFAWQAFRSGWKIDQVFSRFQGHASHLANLYDAEPIDNFKNLNFESDLYLFSVNDAAYQSLLSQLKKQLPLAVHTAGSISQDIFRGYARNYGVIYPYQSISKKIDFEKITVPLCIEADDEITADTLWKISSEWSNVLYFINENQRNWLHLAAVFASNFSNALYQISFQILENQNINPKILFPLMQNTLDKLKTISPSESQTGPAVRRDENVMEKHLSMMENKKLKELYNMISAFIIENSNNKSSLL